MSANITSNKPYTRREIWLFWLGITGILLFAAWLNRVFANLSNLSVDESTHLMWLRLIQANFEPYREIYITYPPLFPLFLQGSWWLWPSNTGLCWSFFGYAALSVVAVGLIARQITTPLAGVAAAFVMAANIGPCYILSEKPSITGALFALWLAMLYRDTGQRRLLVFSAIAMALSLLTKIQSPFIPAVIGFIILSAALEPNGKGRTFHWRPFVINLLIWGGTLIAVIGTMYLLYNTQALWEQSVAQHISAREALLDKEDYWASSLKRVAEFVNDSLWLLPLALLGFIQTFVYKTKDRTLLLLWLVLAVVTVMSNRPLRHKHLVVLLPLFSIWAGIAVSYTWQGLRRFRQSGQLIRAAAIVGAVLGTAYLLSLLPTLIEGWQTEPQEIVATAPANKQTELDFINKVTTPTDCLLTDNMKLAYWSGRLVPPQLAEISSNRFRSGYLTLGDLITAGTEQDCQIVAISSRINRFTPDFKQWAELNYLGRFYYDENSFLYVGKTKTTPNPSHPAAVNLGNIIRFLGYSLEPAAPVPGRPLTLILFWEATAPINTNYTIFTQLRAANNTTLANADHQPFQGVVPTSGWRSGSVIKDVIHLNVPSDLPPGEYRLAVGMYRLDTMERLPIIGDTSGENAILLKPIALPGN